MDEKLAIVSMLTFGFCLASLLGYICQKIQIPSILGFLGAGYLIGPFSPGIVADIPTAEQLAEIGVILMLFGVGMQFHIDDLLNVRSVAIPGAVAQTLITTLACTTLIYFWLDWPISSGILLGVAIGVASTVVLVRVLHDNNLLQTYEGHVAVGWLIVADIFTVFVMLFLPLFASWHTQNYQGDQIIATLTRFLLISAKFFIPAVLIFKWGHRVTTHILTAVARVKSQELFTLTLMGIVLAIATGFSYIFGTSIALGALLAGVIIGQTDTKHQASANALPLRDVFTVIFFLAIGMLFNPITIYNHPWLSLGVLFIILVIKPLIAFVIIVLFRQPIHVALTIAIALAQIGEFSFILAEEAMRLNLLPDEGFDVIVACGLITIYINPLLFRFLPIGDPAKKNSREALSTLASPKSFEVQSESQIKAFELPSVSIPKVIVVGYGLTGEEIVKEVLAIGKMPIVVESNIDTVGILWEKRIHTVFGDATQAAILEAAHIREAHLLVITVPETEVALAISKTARQLSSNLIIISKVDYSKDEPLFWRLRVETVCSERECSKGLRIAVFRWNKNRCAVPNLG